MKWRVSMLIAATVLFLQAGLANAAILPVIHSPEASYSFTRETTDGVMTNISETGFPEYSSVGQATYDTVTGLLTIPYVVVGSGQWIWDDEVVEWNTEEILRVNTFGPEPTATLERVSCWTGSAGTSPCDNFLTPGMFSLEQVLAEVTLNGAANYVLEYHVEGSMNNLGQSSSMVADYSVPLPAAAWLFGSALLSLAGLKRRKAA